MLRLTLILTLGLARIGLSQDLTGQVFLLAEEFFEDKCEVVADCDCCGTELFFLSNTKFGFVSRCLSGDSYFSGTYTLKTNKLTLNFNKKYVDEIVDEEYNVEKYETRQTKIDKVEFDIKQCGQKTRLTHLTTADWKNGVRYKETAEKSKTKVLLTSKPWKQLSD
jgi:hypothetical protein